MSFTASPKLSEFKTVGQVAEGIPSSAYVHIPFCRRRCFYCDFPVSVVGDRLHGDNSGTIQEYVAALCREIHITPALCQSLRTVFFGGGTPSLLSANQLSRILATLDRNFGIAESAEISMEVDPGTFSLEQLQGYKAAGVNRVSLGCKLFKMNYYRFVGDRILSLIFMRL